MAEPNIERDLFPIPETIDPPRKCISISIPDDPTHQKVFFGNLYTLTRWFNWQRTGDTSGKQAAAVWLEIFEEAMSGGCCEIEYRLNGCEILEFSTDGGENWTEIANFAECFPALYPADATRNIIIPDGNHPAMIFRRTAGYTGFITSHQDHEGNLLAGTRYDGAIQTGRAGFNGRVLFGMSGGGIATLNANGTIMEWDTERLDMIHPSSVIRTQFLFTNEIRRYDTTPGIKLGFTFSGGSSIGFGVDPVTTAMFYVQPWGTGMNAHKVRAKAGQAADLVRHEKSDGSLYSGVDQIGRYFLSEVTGDPTDTTARRGTLVYETEGGSIFYAVEAGGGGVEWVKLLSSLSGQAINEVVYETDPDATEGLATLVNGTLGIVFNGKAQSVADVPRIYHSSRPRPISGQSDSVVLALDANSKQMLPWSIENGDTLTVSDFTGWVSLEDGSFVAQGYTGDGRDYHTLSASGAGGSDYLLPDEPPMSLIFQQSIDAIPFTKKVGITALLAGEIITDKDDSNPYGTFFLNRKTDLLMSGLGQFGNIQFKVSLNAVESLTTCGESVFSTGLHGWYLKPASEEKIDYWNDDFPEETILSGGQYIAGVGFKTQQKDLNNAPNNGKIIIAFLKANFAPTVMSNYEMVYDVIDNDKPFHVVVAVYRTVGGWTGWTGTSVDSTLGEHTYISGSLAGFGEISAICIQLRTNRVAEVPSIDSEAIIKSITLNCED